MIELFLLKPETIPDLAKKTGIPEENLRNLYDYDQEFSLVTKICVVEKPDQSVVINKALREAAERWLPRTNGICPTCMGRSRQTTGLVCQTCGHDYGKD